MKIEDFITTIENIDDELNFRGFKICKVISKNPFVFEYKGVKIGAIYGDKVYVHPLFVSDLINQNVESLSDIQNFKSSTAYNSPSFVAKIEGSVPDFIKDFYQFYKNWQSVFILNEGDLITVLDIEDNEYLVFQKIIKNVYEEGEENN